MADRCHRHRRHRRRAAAAAAAAGQPGLFVTLLLSAAVVVAVAAGIDAPAAPVGDVVEGWLQRMTLEEKVAQMNYVPIGSILVDPETVRFCLWVCGWGLMR